MIIIVAWTKVDFFQNQSLSTQIERLFSFPPVQLTPVAPSLVLSLWEISQLTAKCVASLLEHLLEGDELLAKHGDGDANLNSRPVEPGQEPLTVRRPSTTTPHANPPEPEPQPTLTTEPEAEVANARIGEALSERENTPEKALSSASAAPSSAPDTCLSVSRPTPVILVGFGTGANSLLYLATEPLRQERSEDLSGGNDGDGGRNLCDDVDSEFNEAEWGCDTGGGVEAGGGLLTSILSCKGFGVGGLVLVNGFVSLDEQSTQARGRRGGQ